MTPLVVDAILVVLVASAPVLIERARGLAHAAGDLEFMFIPHYAWWWSRPRWLGGWNAWIFGGFPSNADPLVGHVHPLGVVWALLPPLDASAVEGALGPALAGLGMLLYLRRIGCGRTGSVAGALAFACGGYVHAHAMHPEKLRSVIAIPWALLAVEALDGRRLVAGLGLATGVLVAGGHPQTIAFSLGLVAAYGLVFGAGRRAAVVLGIAAGVAIPAVTWLPAIELVARSSHVGRTIAGVDHLTAACAHTLVVPFGCGGGRGPFYGVSIERFPGCGIVDCTGYPGMLVWLLLLAGLPRVLASARGRFWIAVGIAGLVLSTDLVERVLPIPGLRAPSRALLWWSAASAVGAALVLAPGEPGGRRGRAWWAAAVVLVAVVAWASARGPAARRASIGSLAVLATTAVVARRGGHWPVVAVLAADLALFGAELHAGAAPPVASAAIAELRDAQARMDAEPDPDAAAGRVIAVPALHDVMWAQVARVRMLQGWNVLVPAAYTRLLAGESGAASGYEFAIADDPALFEPRSHVLDLLRARTVLVRAGALRDARWAAAFADARWRAAGESAQWRYVTNGRVRPIAWLVHRVRVMPDDEALRLVRGESGTFDPAGEALASEPLAAGPAAAPGRVRVVENDDDRLVLEASASADAVLVTSELAYPGWTAEVDGRAAPVRTVNAGFRALELPAGEHTVVFAYRPMLGRIGLGLGALGMLVVLGCALPRARAREERG